jgi:hypothetical protein
VEGGLFGRGIFVVLWLLVRLLWVLVGLLGRGCSFLNHRRHSTAVSVVIIN